MALLEAVLMTRVLSYGGLCNDHGPFCTCAQHVCFQCNGEADVSGPNTDLPMDAHMSACYVSAAIYKNLNASMSVPQRGRCADLESKGCPSLQGMSLALSTNKVH